MQRMSRDIVGLDGIDVRIAHVHQGSLRAIFLSVTLPRSTCGNAQFNPGLHNLLESRAPCYLG